MLADTGVHLGFGSAPLLGQSSHGSSVLHIAGMYVWGQGWEERVTASCGLRNSLCPWREWIV